MLYPAPLSRRHDAGMSVPDLACPACSAPFTPGAAACPACGIRLVGPDAMRLWEVDQQIAALRAEAAGLLESMRAPLPAGSVASTVAAHGAGRPERRAARLTGQGLLLGFGALLLLSAVSVFVLVAWTLIGVVGQAVLLTGATVTAALASRAASTRGLRAAAHTSAVIAIGVSVLMAQGAYSLDVAGLGDLLHDRRQVDRCPLQLPVAGGGVEQEVGHHPVQPLRTVVQARQQGGHLHGVGGWGGQQCVECGLRPTDHRRARSM